MTDVATTGGGTAPAQQRAGGSDESWLALILHEMAILEQVLDRVGDKVTVLQGVAKALDETLTRVDEESERVEAPTETKVATDASSTVGLLISKLVSEVGQHCRTTKLLTLTARSGLKPARDGEDRQKAIGAGPKLLATAGK